MGYFLCDRASDVEHVEEVSFMREKVGLGDQVGYFCRAVASPNKSKHADLVKLSLFLKKYSKKPPTSPNRCLRR